MCERVTKKCKKINAEKKIWRNGSGELSQAFCRVPKSRIAALAAVTNWDRFHIHSAAGWDLTGGRGDVSWSLDFGIPPTGDESDVPGWDAFDPPHWSKLWG